MNEPIPILQPLGQEISPLSSMLDLSRIELRRIVQQLQEQVAELQRENHKLAGDKVRMMGELAQLRAATM